MTDAQQAIDCAEVLLARRDLLRAREAFDEAERLGWAPDHCSGGRWLACMLHGDFEAAWREGDAIRGRGAPDEHRFWLGEDIRGKRVMVRSLHGFGDAVQMLRFAPALAASAASVVYEVSSRFVALAQAFPSVDEVVTWGEDAPAEPATYDVQVEIMELPYLLRLTADQLPFATQYLRLPEQELARTAAAMGACSRPRVGVVWTSGEWNLTRCMPRELIATWLKHAGLEFWSLEAARHSADAQALHIRDASQSTGDGLLPLAATIAHLDLIITVDTLAAHLAGALGKPVWLLLQHAADWRWMTNRNDSPWYPSMRLFRQQKPGDWAGVAAAVREALSTAFPG